MSNITTPSNTISLTHNNNSVANFTINNTPTKTKPLACLAAKDFPEATWNLGGAFLYNQSQNEIVDFIKEHFAPHCKIQEVHGAPPCLWTLEWYQTRTLMTPVELTSVLQTIAPKVTFVLQFDNPAITEKMLNDYIGNSLLNMISQLPNAAVEVSSDLLAQHIRKNFPKLSLYAGLNKIINDNVQGNLEAYLNLAKHYKKVALHPDDALQPKFLKLLAKKGNPLQFEITVNDTCLHQCKCRQRHIQTLAEIRQTPWDVNPLRQRHQLLAEAKCEDVDLRNPVGRANILAREELQKIYQLGFRKFRIQAETLRSELTYIWTAMRWFHTTEPEHWHHFGLITSSLASKIATTPPTFTTGLNVFTQKKYD